MTHPTAALLSRQAQIFAQAYAIGQDGTDAYRAIKPSCTANLARKKAAWFLAQSTVRQYIRELEHDAFVRNGITQDRILQHLSAIAFSDITEALGKNATSLKELPPKVRWAIKKYTATKGPNGFKSQIEYHDKLAALDRLCKMVGLSEPDKINVDASTHNTQINFNF